ncbi:hypothetical protein P8452_10508 [Trifolium repens]|nr:hypothetical protein P8452_10508 [Trifolium repens]
MDLTFLVDKQENFSIQVCFFDSFLDVKEKIYKYQGLPISKQNLFFNGKLLKDEDIIINTKLIQDSCIIIKLDQDMPIKITLRVRFPTDKEKEESFSIEVSFFDSFLEVKEKIYNYQNLPISNQELYFNGKLLKDEDIIMNSELVQDSCIFIKTKLRLQVQFPGYGRYGSLKYFPQVYIDETIMQLKEKIHNKLNFMKINDMLIMFPALKRRAEECCQSSKKLNLLFLLPMFKRPGQERYYGDVDMVERFEMESCAKVSELKKVLEDLYNWIIPEDDGEYYYFFIHEEHVMLENESFEWNQVEDGGIIHLFDSFTHI